MALQAGMKQSQSSACAGEQDEYAMLQGLYREERRLNLQRLVTPRAVKSKQVQRHPWRGSQSNLKGLRYLLQTIFRCISGLEGLKRGGCQ